MPLTENKPVRIDYFVGGKDLSIWGFESCPNWLKLSLRK
jgi:hypothetical protein